MAGCNVVALPGVTLNSAPACNADGAFNQIMISNLVPVEVPGGTNIAFEVNAFTNPGDYIPFLGDAKFTLESSSSGKIDEGSYTFKSWLFTKSYIKTFNVRADDLTNGNYPVSYTFSLEPSSRVVAGAYIQIQFPSEITPSNVNNLITFCLT